MKKNQIFFAKIPYEMIDKMSGADIKFYAALALHCHGSKTTCKPGIERISYLTNLGSTATIAKAQKNLKKAGWISEIKHRFKNSNVYKIKKVNKRYAEIPETALNLSNTTFKLYCYLTKKCKDTKTTIKTSTIKNETGIKDNRTLLPALIELHDKDFIDFPSFVCSRQIHTWKIVKTNPAKTKEPLDKNPAKNEEQENENSAKTKVLTLQKVKGYPAKTKDKRNFFEINLFERNCIMQNGSSFLTEKKQDKRKKDSNINKPEKNNSIIEEQKKESSSQKKRKMKVSLSNKDKRKIRKKYKEKIFDMDRNKNSFFTAKEFAILNDRYDNLPDDEKQIVDSYVAHEILLYDIDPESTENEIENLVKIFRCEYLVPENKLVPERTIIRDHFKNMTPEERQAEIDNDPVVKFKENKLKERKALGEFDDDDLMALQQYIYEKYYDKGKGVGAGPASDDDDKDFDMLDAWGKTG